MDMKLISTPDGGEIVLEAGVLQLSNGIREAVMLSWFGGNFEDSGEPQDLAKTWWANFDEDDEASRYRSRTQYVLTAMPYTTGNRVKLEQAMADDLAWMTDTGVADEIRVAARLAGGKAHRVELYAWITVDGEVVPIDETQTWGELQ